MTEITIEELLKLSTLLNSDDLEMRDLGVAAYDELFKSTYYAGCPQETKLYAAKRMVGSKAYCLGLEKSKQLKERYDNRTSN